MFLNKQESNFIIPSDGMHGIGSCKNKLGFDEDPTLVNVSSKNKSDWIVISDDFSFCLVTCEPYFMFINCALTPFLDSAL